MRQGVEFDASKRAFLAIAAASGAGASVWLANQSGLLRNVQSVENFKLNKKDFSPIVEFENSKEKYQDYAFEFYNILNEAFQRDKKWYREKTRTFGFSHEASNWSMSRVAETELDLVVVSKDQGTKINLNSQHEKTLARLNTYYDTASNYGSDPQSSSFYIEILGVEGESTSKTEYSEKFNDDNIWNGLNATREGNVQQAKLIFDFVIRSWDPKEGGIYWKEQNRTEKNRYKNTVTNAGALQLALRLYQTSDTEEKKLFYESWALKLFQWVDKNVKDFDELYLDGIGDNTKWSYNQGLMVGNYTFLYDIYRESNPHLAKIFLNKAIRLANKSIDYYDRALKGSKQSKLYLDYINHPEFNAIYYRNLLALSLRVNDKELKGKIVQTMLDYVKEVGIYNYDDRSKMYIFKKQNEYGEYEDTASKFLVKEFGMLQIFAMLGAEEEDYQKFFYMLK